MSEALTYQKKESLEIGLYIFLGVFMAIIVPLTIGFGFRGFEDSFIGGKPLEFGSLLVSYMIYYIFILAAFAVIIYPIMNLILIKKGQHPATQENPRWYRIFTVSLIHNPEQGGFYTLFRLLGMKASKNYARWTISILRIFAISIIIFASLGALSLTVPEAQIIGVPNAVFQQATPASEVLFTAEPPAFSETGSMLFLLLFLLGINAYICARFRLGIVTFFLIALLIVSPLVGFLWTGLHNIVYASSDQARFATFIFGWFGSTMTILTGSFIPWYTWHYFNNFFAALARIAPGNADVVFFSWLAIGLFTAFYVSIELWLYLRRKKNKKEEGFVEPTFK